MMDKERRKKKMTTGSSVAMVSEPQITSMTIDSYDQQSVDVFSKNCSLPDNSNSIQTEIRTDDFVVRLLLSIFCIFFQTSGTPRVNYGLFDCNLLALCEMWQVTRRTRFNQTTEYNVLVDIIPYRCCSIRNL